MFVPSIHQRVGVAAPEPAPPVAERV
jgi:hypothetical protein